jgi:carboxymethylenebutenolidase
MRTLSRTLALLGILVFVSSARADGPAEPRHVEGTFPSGGKKVAIERYEPAADGKHPAILVLHAIDGLSKPADGDTYRGAARRYAAKGYVVLMVSYFDRTGNGAEQVKLVREQFTRYAKGECKPDEEKAVIERFGAWIDVVADAVGYARRLPNVDGDRVGLVGFSLGAYLALAAAADRDLKLCAVVDLFGGLPKSMHEKAKTLPATLIIHGDADAVVPVAEARALRDLLEKAKRPCECHVYEGAGHVFAAPANEKADVAALLRTVRQMKDADERTAAFLQEHLNPAAR